MHFVRLDYHTESSYVSAFDKNNREIWNGRLDSSSELADFLKVLDDVKVSFEEGYGWPRLAKMLNDTGVELTMCHPEHNRRIVTNRRESDRRDAKNLAVYLETDGFKHTYMPGVDICDERRVV